jgi:hypothetical protein
MNLEKRKGKAFDRPPPGAVRHGLEPPEREDESLVILTNSLITAFFLACAFKVLAYVLGYYNASNYEDEDL